MEIKYFGIQQKVQLAVTREARYTFTVYKAKLRAVVKKFLSFLSVFEERTGISLMITIALILGMLLAIFFPGCPFGV